MNNILIMILMLLLMACNIQVKDKDKGSNSNNGPGNGSGNNPPASENFSYVEWQINGNLEISSTPGVESLMNVNLKNLGTEDSEPLGLDFSVEDSEVYISDTNCLRSLAPNEECLVVIGFTPQGSTPPFVTLEVFNGTQNDTLVILPAVSSPSSLAVQSTSLAVSEDNSIQVSLSPLVTSGSAASYAIIANPTQGQISNFSPSSGTFTYTPNANFFGNDTLSFRASNATQQSNVAQINFFVSAVVDPISLNNVSASTVKNTPVTIPLTVNNPDGGIISFVATAPVNGSVSFIGASAIYQPALNFIGTDSFFVQATNGMGTSNSAAISVTITDAGSPVNTPPVANSQIISTTQNTPATLTLNGTDAEGGALTYSVLTQPASGSLTGSAPNLTYTPNNNFTGTDTFSFSVSDGALSATGTVTINVTSGNPVNLPAVANNLSFTINEDMSLSSVFSVTDDGAAQLSFQIVQAPVNGVINLFGNGSFQYIPNSNYSGTETILYRAIDGIHTSNTATITITVSPINDAPVVGPLSPLSAQLSVATPLLAANLSVTDADTAPANLIYTLVSSPLLGTLRVNGNLVPTGGTFTQANINEGVVAYTGISLGSLVDTINLSLSDGVNTTPISLSVNLFDSILVFSDDFTRANSDSIGNNWVERGEFCDPLVSIQLLGAVGADLLGSCGLIDLDILGLGADYGQAELRNNNMSFVELDNVPYQPEVSRTFTSLSSGTVTVSFTADFLRTTETDFAFYITLGEQNVGAITTLVWGSPSRGLDNQGGFGILEGTNSADQITILNQRTTVLVTINLDNNTYSVNVNGQTRSNVAFTQNVGNFNYLSFLAHRISSSGISRLLIDDVVIKHTP